MKVSNKDSQWDAENTALKVSVRNAHWIYGVCISTLFFIYIVVDGFSGPDKVVEFVPVAFDPETAIWQQFSRLSDNGENYVTSYESMAASSIAAFVNARESYDYWYLSKYYNTVQSMAVGDVAIEYEKLYGPQYKNDEQLKELAKVIIDDINVSAIGGSIRTVTFTKQTLTATKSVKTRHQATITFGYDESLILPTKLAIVNPIRFQVYAYTVQDMIGGAS